MASTHNKTGARPSGSAATDTAASPQSSQRQLVLAAEAASQLMRNAEIWSQLQLRAVQRSSQTWRQAAERMRAATSPLDVIGAQNQVLMDSAVQCMQLAQEMLQAGVAAQQQQSAAVHAADAQEAPAQQEPATTTAESMVASMLQTPMGQAWQTMMNPMGMGLNGAAAAAVAGR